MKHLEDDYKIEYLNSTLKDIRIGLVLACMLYAAFGILDAILIPDGKHITWMIRYLFVCPCLLISVFLTQFTFIKKYIQPMLALLVVIAGSGIILMILIAPPPVNYSYYAGLILVFIFGYTFVRVRFIWASSAGWIVIILYEFAAIVSNTPIPVLINNNFFFISSNIIGMLACYSIELYSRHAFYLNRCLVDEKEKVRSVNTGLEEKIEERTREIKKINIMLQDEIKERKRSQDELRKSASDWQNTFDATNSAIWVLSQDQVILRANKSTKTIFKKNHHDVIGKHCFEIAHGTDQHITGCPVVKSKKTLKRETMELKIDQSWYEVTLDPILDDAGHYSGAVHIVNDITDQKKQEEQLRQARKMESIGTLTGGVAHDFNNILSMILGNAELALEDLQEWSPVYENIRDIKSASLRASEIVRQLLNFSRVTDHQHKPINVTETIREGLSFIRSTIPTTIEIQKQIPEEKIMIMGDPIQINQILINLCTNSFQAMEHSGGILSVKLEKKIHEKSDNILYPDLKPGVYLNLTICDTGPGIHADIKNRIFDPYFTTKDIGKGSGLGLSVVHGIVKNHHGIIQLNSNVNRGAEFSVLIPVIDNHTDQRKDIPDVVKPGVEQILFVDDEAVIVDMTKKLLGNLGYTVQGFMNPKEALKVFQDNPFDFNLVITDMTMPEMTGVDLTENILKIRSDIPVIICTGHSSQIDEEKAGKVGIMRYLMKPVSMTEYAKVIREVLDQPNTKT